MLSRRHLLALGGATGGALLIPGGEAALGGPRSAVPPSHVHDRPIRPASAAGVFAAGEPFTQRMPLPPVLAPTSSFLGTDYYQVPIQKSVVEILPGVKTPVLSYGGGFVGPTIRVKTGRRAHVTFANRMTMPANVHLHGGHVPADSDGHPMDVIEPGASYTYRYPNQQRGATLWYHDHSHHTEAEHLYRGLHGFYIIDDDNERDLNLPADTYDVPILLRDALFDANGALVFDPADPLNRPTVLANGRCQPYFPVAARKYRFRLLNASLHRKFQLSLGGATFSQISTDGGLLPAPVPLTQLQLTPGERADVVIDFSAYPLGTKLILEDASGPVLRFDVSRLATDRSRVPDRLRPAEPLGRPEAVRALALAFNPADITFTINGQTFDAGRVDARIKQGTTEIWHITNTDVGYGGIVHNFHMHMVQFRILDRDGVPPAASEAGLKDTMIIPPGSSVRIQATFAGYQGKYLYHCHLLEHSQLGMMAQMEIVP